MHQKSKGGKSSMSFIGEEGVSNHSETFILKSLYNHWQMPILSHIEEGLKNHRLISKVTLFKLKSLWYIACLYKLSLHERAAWLLFIGMMIYAQFPPFFLTSMLRLISTKSYRVEQKWLDYRDKKWNSSLHCCNKYNIFFVFLTSVKSRSQ